MKVKEFTSKIRDLGAHPRVYIREGGSILGSGTPEAVGKRYGERKVDSFFASNRDEITIYIEPID